MNAAPGMPASGDTRGEPFGDAVLAARLFASDPATFGGLHLRGSTPARDAIVAALELSCTCRRLPGHVDAERLDGGIDIAASLAAGRPITTQGLLAQIAGGVLIVPMAERLDEALAGRLAQALDDRQVALVLLDDGIEPDERPPEALCDRIAFACDLSASREQGPVDLAPLHSPAAEGPAADVALLGFEALTGLATTAAALGVASLRPLLFAGETARVHAAFAGRTEAARPDLEAAARLVFGPRATQLPSQNDEPSGEEPPPPPERDADGEGEAEPKREEGSIEDQLIAAAQAAIPADLLAQLNEGNAPRRSSASGTGRKRRAGLRGKPLGARPGMPRGGARLALVDTLRAAVPWQGVRRREHGVAESANSPILIRKSDLRVRRFEERSARVTVFAVDASGSAAFARLAEAKGAVELMLSQAYVTRSQVALVAFRGDTAETLLPPTRSLTRARRALAELPGGGGTPLAIGLDAARETAHAVMVRGRTPSIVVLTDGRANITAAGTPGRKQAGEDAQAAAKAIARSGMDALVIDISARPGHEGPALASAMQARYLALPRADAKALHEAIAAPRPGRGPA